MERLSSIAGPDPTGDVDTDIELGGSTEQCVGVDVRPENGGGKTLIANLAEAGMAGADPPTTACVLPLRQASVPTGRVLRRMDDPEVLRRVRDGLVNLP